MNGVIRYQTAFLLILKNYIPDSCRLADILQELAAVSIKLVNCMDMSANKAIF